MIRMASQDDIPALTRMSERFVKETAYADFIKVDEGTAGAWLTGLIMNETSFIIVSDGDCGIIGAMGCALIPHFLDGKKSAFELFWWVEPEHRGAGGELFRHYNTEIKNRGAVRSFLAAPEGPGKGISAFYERQGYSKFETTFVREF